MMQEKKKEILESLKEFPSSFQLDQKGITLQRLMKVRKTTYEQHDENTTLFQKNADKNLLTYLELRTHGSENRSKAYKYNKEVRVSEPENVIALANHARMLIDDDDLPGAEEEVGKLNALKGREELWANATAELAYSYSKFGSREDLKEATKLFEEFVFYHPERWEWGYRYGVVIQRRLNPGTFACDEDGDASDLFMKGLGAFVGVIKCPDADKTTVALAYTKVTSMSLSYDMLPEEYKHAKKTVDKCRAYTCKALDVKELDSEECMEKALGLKGNNYEVLQEYGRYCRRNNDSEKAKKYLEQSREILPTTINCLHLGILEVEKYYREKYPVTQKRIKNPSGSRFIKSVFKTAPRSMPLEDDQNNVLLNSALKYFDEANELCEYTSTPVLHNQGLVYRRLKRAEDAIKCFQQARRNAGSQVINIISAYEQQGYCFEWLAKQSDEKSDILNQKAITMLFFALEAYVHLDLPFSYHNQSTFTLQDLLKSKLNKDPAGINTHKDLATFHELLGDHPQALEYLKRVIVLNPLDSDAHLKVAELLKEGGQRQEAVHLLTMMMAPNSVHRNHVLKNKDILVDARKQVAKQNLKNGENYIASENFRRAYSVVFEIEDTDMDDRYQIFITGQETDNCFQYFSEIIEKYLGLSCFCSNDILPGTYTNDSLSTALESSRSFLFVFPNAEELRGESKHLVESTLKCIQQKPSGSLYSVSVSGLGDLPQSLRCANFNDVPPYTSWRDVPKDSDEFVDLVMQLFEGITTLVC